MKFFYDTEFWERGNAYPIIPISIGIMAENGDIFYAEYPFDWSACDSTWLHEHVKPHLIGQTAPAWLTKSQLVAWVHQVSGGNKPEFWAYYADYDHVVLCQTFGSMIDLPKGWPMYTRDIKQWCDMLGNPQLPKQESTEHRALDDARWTRQAWRFLKEYEAEQKARVALIHAGEWTEEG